MKNQMTTDTQSRSAGTARVDREGFAMVTALLVVLVLSVLAVGATWLASSEKKTTVAEAVHVRSVFAADAGSEAGINFIRNSESPPMRTHSVDETAIEGTQTYSFDAAFDGREMGALRLGFSQLDDTERTRVLDILEASLPAPAVSEARARRSSKRSLA